MLEQQERHQQQEHQKQHVQKEQQKFQQHQWLHQERQHIAEGPARPKRVAVCHKTFKKQQQLATLG
jgi:hypothetical protein